MINDNLFNKLKSETDRFIKILHDLYGLYFDSIKGFDLHRKDMEKNRKIGVPSLCISNSDPTDQNALILHYASIDEIICRNAEDGDNVNKTRCNTVVMILEHWNHDIRKKIADIFGLKDSNDIESNIMGELNKIRQDVLHNRGKVSNCKSNKIIRFYKGEKLKISKAMFEKIFEEIFKYLNNFFINHTKQKAYIDNSLNLKAKAEHLSIKHKIIKK